jgi:hypothetical protein
MADIMESFKAGLREAPALFFAPLAGAILGMVGASRAAWRRVDNSPKSSQDINQTSDHRSDSHSISTYLPHLELRTRERMVKPAEANPAPARDFFSIISELEQAALLPIGKDNIKHFPSMAGRSLALRAHSALKSGDAEDARAYANKYLAELARSSSTASDLPRSSDMPGRDSNAA